MVSRATLGVCNLALFQYLSCYICGFCLKHPSDRHVPPSPSTTVVGCLGSSSYNFYNMSVTLHTTHGNIKIELHCELAPITCKNFLALCAKGAYDGCIFHRNIKNFIIQGGDPTNTGKGGESIYGKPFSNEIV